MAADPKTITQLTERSGALVATDEMEVQISGETTTKKKALSAVRTFVIGSATIGGNAAGDIVTTNGTQTQSNKTLVSPVITTAATLPAATTIGTVTAAELLKLAGLLPTTAELNFVDGVTSAIQTQINALAALGSALTKTFTYGVIFTASGTTKEITESTILTAIAVGTNYIVNPATIILNTFLVSSGTHTQMDASTTVTNEFTTLNDELGYHLEKLKIGGITNASQYQVTITFMLSLKAGV